MGKGIVDIMLFKKNMRSHLLNVVLPKTEISPDIKSVIIETCSTFKKFRDALGHKLNSTVPSQSWRAGWPPSADAFLSLVEDHA